MGGMSQDAVDALVKLLDLEPIEVNIFRGLSPDEDRQRVFGGQVAGQALVAAARTVEPGRSVHSLHAYFLRPGDVRVPILYEVDRIRDGRSFTTRRVEASQEGEPIFTMVASFHVEEGDPEDDWQLPAPAGVPGPDELGDRPSAMSQWTTLTAFDMRMVRQPTEGDWPNIHPFWIRHSLPLPDDPALHACVLAFVSDMAVVGAALAPGRKPRAGAAPQSGKHRGHMGASLDHAVWFHRPAPADDWVLFSVDPVSNAGARGLARGTMHTAGGSLVASVAQEALLRVAR